MKKNILLKNEKIENNLSKIFFFSNEFYHNTSNTIFDSLIFYQLILSKILIWYCFVIMITVRHYLTLFCFCFFYFYDYLFISDSFCLNCLCNAHFLCFYFISFFCLTFFEIFDQDFWRVFIILIFLFYWSYFYFMSLPFYLSF